MSIDINKVIEGRILRGAQKQAEEQADALGKVIQAEIDRMGLEGHWCITMDAFLGQVRDAYEQKVICDRVNAIVDGLLVAKEPARTTGDTVVITTPSHMSKEGRDKLSAYVTAQSGCNAMVLDGGATFSGVLKADSVDQSIARLDAHNLT